MSLSSSLHIPADGVRLMCVVHVFSRRGDGSEFNPLRGVAQYWSPEGVLLAEFDHLHEDPDMAAHEVLRLRAEIQSLSAQLRQSPIQAQAKPCEVAMEKAAEAQ